MGGLVMRKLPEKEWYSVEEVAEHFSIEPDTIRKMCREHRIPGARQIGRQWRIPRSFVVGEPPADTRNESR